MIKEITFIKLLFAGITLAENAMIYNFVGRLAKAKCECSEDWRREAITAMTAFIFVTILMGLFLDLKEQGSYAFMLILYSLLYFIIVLSYTYKLRQDKCKCARGLDASVIYYTRMINVLLSIFFMTFAVIGGVFLISQIYRK
jgi:hypothetical protein